ncbi:testis-specific gene A8 protein-like [Melospiza georgiana]|uniref:testis-specific gene A8 protein-like n=1 Tax=Melospiza georgiana TaxID=44398 RepID=UPI0025ACE503|nr:testis-specific gene A8 protein-like [Melospiza georgiana]
MSCPPLCTSLSCSSTAMLRAVLTDTRRTAGSRRTAVSRNPALAAAAAAASSTTASSPSGGSSRPAAAAAAMLPPPHGPRARAAAEAPGGPGRGCPVAACAPCRPESAGCGVRRALVEPPRRRGVTGSRVGSGLGGGSASAAAPPSRDETGGREAAPGS